MGGLATGALIAPAARSQAPSSSQDSERLLRTTLDAGWSISTDPSDSGVRQKWFRSAQPGAASIRVPSILQEQFPAYHGAVWYWNSFRAPENPFRHGVSLLLFHAVDYYAEVWLNGIRIGEHEGGETPFTLNATQAMRPAEVNLLAVRILNPPTAGIDGFRLKETAHGNKVQPYATGNRYDYGGMVEPVELLLAPAVRISDLHIRPDWQSGAVRVSVTVENHTPRPAGAALLLRISGGPATQPELAQSVQLSIPPGDSVHQQELRLPHHRLWDIEDPCCNSLSAQLSRDGAEPVDAASSRFGFRDFRLVDGYFHLNGRKIFIKCTHTGNHVPYSQVTPPPGSPDMLRMDLVYAKASGFNMVRFISGVAHPYELDLCDTLGLLIYEESLASWLLKDSPRMQPRFQYSVREMVLRDRNHPCIAMWGLLNETGDGPVFREAVASLPLVRAHDPDRLVLLSSGRFDGHLEIGSASNPGESAWQYVWGREAADAAHTPMQYPSGPGTGDFHFYPTVPQSTATKKFLRTLGAGEKPVFLSEYGIGSMMHVLYESRKYEQAGIRPDAEDNVLMHSMAARLLEDWNRFGMETAYPFPETLLEESERAMAEHRQVGFDLIRSNPQIAGFNLTGMLDHGMTGEGLWRFWRDWKPTIFDAVRDGWSPVRWCLFAEPAHIYSGEAVSFEALLANECVLTPGQYPVEFRITGPPGVLWKRHASIHIPDRSTFAVPVLSEQVRIEGPPGAYQLTPSIPRGIAAPYRSQTVLVADRNRLPRLDGLRLTTWGVPADVTRFLQQRGAQLSDFQAGPSSQPESIVVGIPGPDAEPRQWLDLARRIAQGGVAFFLSPQAFAANNDPSRWFPAAKKGRICEFHDWLYHKECVAKPGPFFDGLDARGLLHWSRFGPTYPRMLFDGFEVEPASVCAAAFATGYTAPGGYASGILLATFPFAAGTFVINSFELAGNIGHPVADRMLINAALYAGNQAQKQTVPLPANFDSMLSTIGYAS